MVFRYEFVSMTSYNPERLKISDIKTLLSRDDPLILEIGAAGGSDSARFLEQFSKIRLFCFEPDPRSIARFEKRIQDPRCHFFPIAIGDRSGFTSFYLSVGTSPKGQVDWSHGSSIMKPTGHLSFYPWCKFKNNCVVPIMRLDDWSEANLDPLDVVDFIWADLQGAEIEMIRGGMKTLERTHFLYMEFSEVMMFDGQIAFHDLMKALPNWTVIGFYEMNPMYKMKTMLLQNEAFSSI